MAGGLPSQKHENRSKSFSWTCIQLRRILGSLFRGAATFPRGRFYCRGAFAAGCRALSAHFAAFASDFGIKFRTTLAFDGFAALFADTLIERRTVFVLNGLSTLATCLSGKVGIGGEAALFIMVV
jgi:hypothetical protein